MILYKTGIRSYLVWSSVLALLAGLALLALAPFAGWNAMAWSMLGWGLMVLVGVFGGSWTATLLGSQGVRFFVALIACMLARLTLSLGGVFLVVMFGRESLLFYLLGLAAGFLPIQIFESLWISRRAKIMTVARKETTDPLVAR